MAAAYSGKVAANAVREAAGNTIRQPSFDEYLAHAQSQLELLQAEGGVSSLSVLQELSRIMNTSAGLLRDRQGLEQGLRDLDQLAERLRTITFDANELLYHSHRVSSMVAVAKATLRSALAREESRGAHLRLDFPDVNDALQLCSVARFEDGDITVEHVDEAQADGEMR